MKITYLGVTAVPPKKRSTRSRRGTPLTSSCMRASARTRAATFWQGPHKPETAAHGVADAAAPQLHMAASTFVQVSGLLGETVGVLALLLFDLVRAGDEGAIGAESALDRHYRLTLPGGGTVLIARVCRLLVGMD